VFVFILLSIDMNVIVVLQFNTYLSESHCF